MPSTVIRRFAWRAAEQALDVEFVTGRVYRYHGVPEEVARAMRGSFSRGAFFNRAIRDRYPHERLGGWPPEDEATAPVR
ncbi:MAG: KTSC domain-containing protein [Qipengyuania sp.]|nr:KTSC domain-containing protein [Qipengyuania sp.]